MGREDSGQIFIYRRADHTKPGEQRSGLFSGEKTDSVFIPPFMKSTIYVIIIKAAAVERLLPFHGY
jgi:hypothetical protein